MKVRSLQESLTSLRSFFDDTPLDSEDSSISGNSVEFNKLEIREYARVLGDNPACSSGPPVSLGWEHSPEDIEVSIDEYEKRNPYKRLPKELLLPRTTREQMLRDGGFTRSDVVRATKCATLLKKSRKKSNSRIGTDRMEERIEGVVRKGKKLIYPLSEPQKEFLKWEEALKGAEICHNS
eukprot:CAMPEP_0194377292 /NCGR_PEP_ID=MMETSP0174-20130528/30211_1 /TAXON_ID=216777 /ORGANISM="Proboscia alata, Strain PI-D3" /LENGTH=179 /DNA_ID=CAMNT_0039158545 /DNA_START=36 /DNA_END=575 /DNA_ORIENTATION=-